MKVCVLMGSPRLNGNTVELLKPFVDILEQNNVEVSYITLAEKNILPCKGCYSCQNVEGEYGCIQKDDVAEIMETIISSDCIVLATPIYSWYCTAPMKALLDRHYGLNKFYGSAKGSLWEDKKIAIIATHGYDREYGAGPFATGIQRLCQHSNLKYMGMYSVRDEDDLASFQTEEAINGAIKFANELCMDKRYSVKEMEIETEQLIIKPYVDDDLIECFNLMQDEELFKYLDMDVMTFEEYARLFTWLIKSYDVEYTKDFKYSFNIILKENGKHIGWCGIGGLCFDHATKEIYYLIGKEFWGHGYAKEATIALLDYGFSVMNLDEIVAIVQQDNIASKKVIENMGLEYKYILSGLPKEYEWNNGELYYSLSKEQYFHNKGNK